jgi:ABC-2 type transport system ATP-binding protein
VAATKKDEAAVSSPSASDDRSAEAVLRVRGLVKSFHRGLPPRRRTIEVLKGAELEVRTGELVGLVGENGSGKAP